MSSSSAPSMLNILLPSAPNLHLPRFTASEGQELQSGLKDAVRRVLMTSVDPEKVISEWGQQVHVVIDTITQSIAASPLGYTLREVEVTLGVSADGDLGIVSAGVEGSIKLVFSPSNGRSSDDRDHTSG